MVRRTVATVGLLAALPALTGAVNTIVRKGKYLYDSTTDARFTIKGLAYQPPAPVAATTAAQQANGGFPEPDSYISALGDMTACTRDLPNFRALGINTIRVYSNDPYGDYSQCMNLLNTNGIYVIADLGLPLNGSIDRALPSWHVGLLDQYIVAVDNFAQYPNLLAVGIGNEVITLPNNTAAAPFVKAAARDIKAYIKSKNYPTLVTYSSTDGAQWRTDLANYMTCGDDTTTVDLFGLNTYRWCGDSSYAASGYEGLTTEFQAYPVPAYFSEFGCISQERLWTDVPVMLSAPMSNTWSGGIAFEYFADTLGYGLTANLTGRDAAITTNDDFTRLEAQYTGTDSPTTPAFADADAPAYAACPAPDGVNFLGSNTLPPTPDQGICQCLRVDALPCVIRPTATPNIVGALLDYTCSLLGQNGLSCDDISGNGTTGVYGDLSFCAPADKLSYVMSLYYGSQQDNSDACNFNGNASVNLHAPTSTTGVANAIAACIANGTGAQSAGVFTPTILPPLMPTVSPANSSGGPGDDTPTYGSSGSGGGGKSSSGATVVYASLATALLALAISLLFAH